MGQKHLSINFRALGGRGKRAQSKSPAVKQIAYDSGTKMTSTRTGQVFDFTRKTEVSFSSTFAPGDVPAWKNDLSELWNKVEEREYRARKEPQVGRTGILGFPLEIPPEMRPALIEEFVTEQFVSLGMIVSVHIHDIPTNPHTHLLMTMRKWEPAIEDFGLKERSWNKRENVIKWRNAWETKCNQYLELYSPKTKITCKSFQSMGSKQIPTLHLGTSVKKKELYTNINEEIHAINLILLKPIQSFFKVHQKDHEIAPRLNNIRNLLKENDVKEQGKLRKIIARIEKMAGIENKTISEANSVAPEKMVSPSA